MEYNTYTLDNGLRIIHLPSASKVVYCGYRIAVGSRDEKEGEEGLAHFCEHVTFKGTERRSSLKIIKELESVGGDINAFTNKEDTVYYAAVMREHATKAIDLLTDMVFHSTYPQAEIEKEKEVICDEIESYKDSPSELIYDEFENLLFGGHPLGHNILGTAERVRQFSSDDALRFTRTHYRPDNAVFFIHGGEQTPDSFRKYKTALERLSASMPKSNSDVQTEHNGGTVASRTGTFTVSQNTHQSHVMVGSRAYCATDPRRWVLYLMNNIIGGPGMNTRLNIALRERRGLVYAVDSSMVAYGDTGIWCTYFGCDPSDVKKCLAVVRRELDRFIRKPLSAAQLAAAKRQLKGQIGVASDNRENFALSFGKSFLHHGYERDLDLIFRKIDSVTAEEIQQVAADIFAPERMTTLIYK
ncbi:MAG: pitrilysin family protein [Prevotella sp.]|uniref:M16 family metallopeptidase n=1 Tax=Prevotella sp. TaxID=59823 RepID=UPI002A2F95E9|nr:pitrilysin family protein [Prevotella sp.]MDD7318776.1 pitrilysin family protein [Prevotellaceae bacterium]MDY4019552.1 pitrilysin family protein [Prevotella sp.]